MLLYFKLVLLSLISQRLITTCSFLGKSITFVRITMALHLILSYLPTKLLEAQPNQLMRCGIRWKIFHGCVLFSRIFCQFPGVGRVLWNGTSTEDTAVGYYALLFIRAVGITFWKFLSHFYLKKLFCSQPLHYFG